MSRLWPPATPTAFCIGLFLLSLVGFGIGIGIQEFRERRPHKTGRET